MEKLTNFFLSNVLYKKVYDEDGESLGKLWDIYVTNEEVYPKAIGYKIKKAGEMLSYEFKDIDFYKDGGRMVIKGRGAREIIPRQYSYLLSKHLLDKQIVDINGKKLVRVNDLRMVKMSGEIKVIAVDTGALAIARRLGIGKFVKSIAKSLDKKITDTLIMWDSVESLEMVNDNLKLAVPYKKLSKLHPADIADILEDMDIKYRNKVFMGLEENLAADTLEEIEPDIQAEILENLSHSKVVEVLDNMPNDEIADILDEVDEETAEHILMNLEKEDADEVRELMEYKEETAGSMMNKDFISFNINITCQETIDLLREIKPENEVAYYIYITDDEEKLQGVVSLRDLVISSPDSRLKEIMDCNVITVDDKENMDEIIEISAKYDLISLPVVDKNDKLCGIVIMSDIIDEVLLPTWRKRFRKVS